MTKDCKSIITPRYCHDLLRKSRNDGYNARLSRKCFSIHPHNDKESIKLFLALYLFFFVLNALFPAQSDDLGAGIGGFAEMKRSYLHWNGRLGELVRIWFGSFLAHTPYFAFINAFLCVALLYLLFVLVFGRLPRCSPSVYENLDSKNAQSQAQFATKSSEISSDVAVLCFMLLAFMAYKGFGAVFLWAAGSLNYLWAYCLILGFCVPYRMLAGKIYETSYAQNSCHTSAQTRSIFNNNNRDSSLVTLAQNDKDIDYHEGFSRNDENRDTSALPQYDNDSVIASEQGERGNPLELQETCKNTPLENQQDCHENPCGFSRNDKKIKESLKASAMLFLGILAGWGSEFGIVVATCIALFIVYASYKRVTLPLWAYCGIIGFIAGFCALYFSPGHRSRAERFAEVLDYVSLSKLWAMSLSEKYARFANAFRGDITKTLLMQCATLGIIALLVMRRVITRLMAFSLVVYFVLLCVKWGSVGYFAYLFAPSVAGLCVFGYLRERALNFKSLQNLDSTNSTLAGQTPANPALFLALAGLFLAHFLASLASIQVGLPPRAKLIWVLLGMAMCITLARIYAPLLSERAKSAIKNLVCLSCGVFALFVLYASVDMRLKWERMLASIEAQKALGRNEIIVNKEVFRSFYYGYTDWGNPNEKVNEWPNTSYARFFKVDKFIAE